MPDCPRIVSLLSDYIDGRLPADVRSDLEQHLSGCSECTTFVGTLPIDSGLAAVAERRGPARRAAAAIESIPRRPLHELSILSPMPLAPKPPSASATEMVEVVLPNDANPMGFMLGGAVMHLIDIAAAIAAFRHAHELVVTAAVDGLEFLNPIKVGDFIVLKARVTAVFTTSLEVEVTVFSEEALTGRRQITSRAYLTFVTLEKQGTRAEIPPLLRRD